eukprot:PhF_6_TR42692/c0_g1_i3/m.64425
MPPRKRNPVRSVMALFLSLILLVCTITFVVNRSYSTGRTGLSTTSSEVHRSRPEMQDASPQPTFVPPTHMVINPLPSTSSPTSLTSIPTTQETKVWPRCSSEHHVQGTFRRYVPREVTDRLAPDHHDMQEVGLLLVEKHQRQHKDNVYGPGYYCFELQDIALKCIIGSGASIVMDPSRRSTEYGVRPYNLPKLKHIDTPNAILTLYPKTFPLEAKSVCKMQFAVSPSKTVYQPTVFSGSDGVQYVGGVGLGPCTTYNKVKFIPKSEFSPLGPLTTTLKHCKHII